MQDLRDTLSSDEQARCAGEAAVLVSRRTARRATYGLPAERLRDDGYLGLVHDASAFRPLVSHGTEAELVSKRQP